MADANDETPLLQPMRKRRTLLLEKAKTREHKSIEKRMPAGASDLSRLPKGKDYVRGTRIPRRARRASTRTASR